MNDQIFVRPTVPGARLPDPRNGDLLKADGEWKPRDHNWLRFLARGDVEECAPPADPAPVDPEPAEPVAAAKPTTPAAPAAAAAPTARDAT